MANLNTIYMMMDEKKAVCLVKVGFTKELDVNDYEDDDAIDEDLAKQLKNAGWR